MTATELAISETPAASLPALVQRAAAQLAGASTAAEVLDARDIARIAYDAAKSAVVGEIVAPVHDGELADG